MASSLRNKSQPEEIVRIQLLHFLVEELGYPRSLISTEVSIKNLTDVRSRRRIDVLCSRRDETGISPFLLIECKARKPSIKALYQLIGYNNSIDAPYVALFWNTGFYCLKKSDSGWVACESLPKCKKDCSELDELR